MSFFNVNEVITLTWNSQIWFNIQENGGICMGISIVDIRRFYDKISKINEPYFCENLLVFYMSQ